MHQQTREQHTNYVVKFVIFDLYPYCVETKIFLRDTIDRFNLEGLF